MFISWSGETSRAVANELKYWLPKVIQSLEPYVSSSDINKGLNWSTELASELIETEFGIVCLTPENMQSPWLNYEAGALSKTVSAKVCPVLFHVEKKSVEAPLGQLQLTSIEKEDFSLLLSSINDSTKNPLDPTALTSAFNMWWSTLSEKIDAIPLPPTRDQIRPSAEPPAPKVDNNEMIMEILDRVRSLDAGVTRGERRAVDLPPALVRDIAEVVDILSLLAGESGDARLVDALVSLDRPLNYLRKVTGGRAVSGGTAHSSGVGDGGILSGRYHHFPRSWRHRLRTAA